MMQYNMGDNSKKSNESCFFLTQFYVLVEYYLY